MVDPLPLDGSPLAEVRPRRSVLYVPASNARALAKAPWLPCDAVILDLEDAVAPADKESARGFACLSVPAFLGREVAIRVNGVGTQWYAEDLAAAREAEPTAVVVPKVSSAADVHRVIEDLDAPDIALWVMLETPSAILNATSIASASPSVKVLVMGTNDLAAELRVESRIALLTSLSLSVLAARAADKDVLDGVFNGLDDDLGFLAECREGRELGFDGKTLIHPGQIAVANDVFAPSVEAVAEARGVVEAWGTGSEAVVVHNGRIIEELHVNAARRTLAIHRGDSGRPSNRHDANRVPLAVVSSRYVGEPALPIVVRRGMCRFPYIP